MPAATESAPIRLCCSLFVQGWPQQFTAKRAEAHGFKAETSFDDIIRAHLEDEHA